MHNVSEQKVRSPKFLIACLALAVAPAVYADEDLPAGWRLPSRQDVAENLFIRKKSPSRYLTAVADFNGDGIADTAHLLKTTRYVGEGLWVRLSDGPTFKWVKLLEHRWGQKHPPVGLAMGVDVIPPGVHSYACFDDTKGECNFGPESERPKLKLVDPSLAYFKLDSAASMFFWSRKYNKFLRVWLSD